MGKEQELLQAAKSGNVAQIEKILGVKSRKSGIQSLISRTVNPNHQDELGNSPLHHAALNGHRSSVELLLKYDASANIPDNSGNYPLHLAAWNGHADVARVLLNTGPSRANVNEQNGTEETALHSAAQFGHSLVVAVLLENHADPYVRNSQHESPLDLAAQYGRMETVKQLLNYHPNLLDDVNVIKTHTPLHLAARNGHMNVVSYFLSCGMDVNIKCNRGTALHEASLYGKVDVVNLLLQCGIDATVVDSNNKTVMDLLASHPSARSREIRDLIYASSVKEPVSGRLNLFMQYAERNRAVFSSGKLPGPVTRAFSAIYPREFTYSDVPEPRPFYDAMDPSGFRRSGSHNSIPVRRSRQESLNQSSYDIVPPPRDANAADLAEHVEQQPTSADVDYSLIGPPEELPPGAVPSLSAYEIAKGYTILGSPAHGAGPLPQCPLDPGSSTYSEVRSEGESFHQPQTAFDDYSRLGFASAAEDGITVPSAGAPGRNNPGYFVVGRLIHQHSQSVKQNSDTYDFVSPTPRSRPVSHQPQTVYEIPPLSQRGRGNGQEEDEQVPGASQEDRFQMFGGRSPEVYENTLIHTQRPEQRQHRRSEYDFVKAPSRKTSEPATYDNVAMPGHDMSSHHPIPTEEQGMARYGSVSVPGYYSQSDPTIHDNRASVVNSSSYGDQACPLDIPAYECLQLRKQSDVVSGSTPEMQPFASLPGYEPMAPPENQQGAGEYEFLAPFVGSLEIPDPRGDYETLAMVGPPRPGSRPEAPAMAQQAPGSNSLPVSTPLYEVPPTLSSPVYEIAPPRQTPPTSSPVYEMAPPPRQVGPVPPPRETAMQLRDGHGGQWIEKEDTKPKVPPRRQNPYSVCPLGRKSQAEAPCRPPKAASYEQVRLEGSSSASLDWERERRISPRSPGGEYCTLSSVATGPAETANRTSSGSSERSSTAEIPITPPFSPPSPKTAKATVFEAFETFSPSGISAIPEVPESDREWQEGTAPQPKPLPRRCVTQTSKPKVLPRSDSLHDQEFQLTPQAAPMDTSDASAGFERRQDPFSFPPVASTSEVERLSESKSDFVELHRRFSPYSSREDLTVDNGEVENTRHEPDGAEVETAVKPSPLVYENVLFERNDTAQGCEQNGSEAKPGESKQRPDSYRLSALSADSPMDESEEWKKIEAFLSTIGQLDVPQTLENQIAQSVNAETVPEWLEALDLGQYESSLMANGFDDIRYLNGVIEDDDLLEIGIVDFTHRRTIMEALKPLSRCPRLSDLAFANLDTVADWLESIGLPEYLEVFQHNGFTTLQRVRMLWEVELTSVLEVNLLGHRKRMLASVMEQPKESESKPDKVGTIDVENSSAELEERLAELRIYCPDEKPPAITTAAPTDGLMTAAEALMAGSLKAPEADPQRNEHSSRWKHNSLVLTKGSVNYSILYLGSHAVKKITGLESTIEACRKMRLSTAKLQKIPSVILSISVKGIKFIDGRSKIMVSYHDMKNISYITQDPTDRTVLAYIAKDSKTEKHYCHVFRAESHALSDEVTMTIGQAFELAFDQFIQARKSSSVQ